MKSESGSTQTTLERHNYEGMKEGKESRLSCSCGWESSPISRESYDAHYQYQEFRRHKRERENG